MQTLLAAKGIYIPYYMAEYRKSLVNQLIAIRAYKKAERPGAEKIEGPVIKTLENKFK